MRLRHIFTCFETNELYTRRGQLLNVQRYTFSIYVFIWTDTDGDLVTLHYSETSEFSLLKCRRVYANEFQYQ